MLNENKHTQNRVLIARRQRQVISPVRAY